MKKLILSLFILLFVTSGCTNIDTTLDLGIHKYGAKIETKLSYEKDLYNSKDLQARTILNNYKIFTDDKTSVTTDKKHSVIIANKSVKNIRKEDLDLSSLGFSTNLPEGKFIDVKKNFFVTFYNIDMVYNFPEIIKKINYTNDTKTENKGLKPVYLQEYADRQNIITDFNDNTREDIIANYENNFRNFESAEQNTSDIDVKSELFNPEELQLMFHIKVPGFASYNNADKESAFVYSWNIRKDTPTYIKFQYVVYSSFAISFVILLGIAGLIYFARRILRHDALKRADLNK